ncbi:MAG: DUF2442 domain-containing protein [Clostridia bacterium]|nr:DUF2442 domain-containing protein [Clostridia bacterium]
MYIKDNIAFAGNFPEILKVVEIQPNGLYKLKITFNNGKKALFDFQNLLEFECYKPLADKNVFESVSLDRGIPIWLDGEIDISPEYLYENRIQ